MAYANWALISEDPTPIIVYYIIATINKSIWSVKDIVSGEHHLRCEWTTNYNNKKSFNALNEVMDFVQPLKLRNVDFNIMRVTTVNGKETCEVLGEL